MEIGKLTKLAIKLHQNTATLICSKFGGRMGPCSPKMPGRATPKRSKEGASSAAAKIQPKYMPNTAKNAPNRIVQTHDETPRKRNHFEKCERYLRHDFDTVLRILTKL